MVKHEPRARDILSLSTFVNARTTPMKFLRAYQIARSKWRRMLRWEFWPMWLFYTPIVIWIIGLTLRYRKLTFLSVNPGFPMSGLIGEQKAESLKHLQSMPELARFEYVPEQKQDRISMVHQLMREHGYEFPVVLKPDAGQRGSNVAVIRSNQALARYLQDVSEPLLLQEYVGGSEFGLFYVRDPNHDYGRLFSITEKTFPVVVGDGHQALEQLLMTNPRTHYMAQFLLNLHAHQLNRVLAPNEKLQVVEIGSHCRGSVFLDANHLITPELEQAVHQISSRIPGFYFGRFDVRVPSQQQLQAGSNLKVLEVNGVTSESTNIYDPKHSLIDAYRIMFKQWHLAFSIGASNIKNGATAVTLAQFLRYLVKRD